jgi:N-acetylmuramoyl-L-alanine amidase
MPAILVEHLFFDNYEDAKLLMDDEIVERFAEAQVRTIIEAQGIL